MIVQPTSSYRAPCLFALPALKPPHPSHAVLCRRSTGAGSQKQMRSQTSSIVQAMLCSAGHQWAQGLRSRGTRKQAPLSKPCCALQAINGRRVSEGWHPWRIKPSPESTSARIAAAQENPAEMQALHRVSCLHLVLFFQFFCRQVFGTPTTGPP